MSEQFDRPVVMVTTFVPKPGKMDEFLAVQRAGLYRLVGGEPPAGWLGNRLCRDLQGSAVVMVAMFQSIEAHRSIMARQEFAEHVDRVRPLLEKVESRFCELVFQAGQL